MTESSTSVCHVIHQYSNPVLYIPHQDHGSHFISLLSLLVNQRKVDIQSVRNGSYSKQENRNHLKAILPDYVKWNFAQFSAFSLFLCSLLSISKSKYIRNNYCFGWSNTSCFGHYLLAPPASGETMQLFLQSGIVSLIHFKTAGSAYKLSTGMSKKPYQNNFINQKICCMFTFKLSPVTHKIWVKVVINIQFTTEILNF